MFPQRLYQTPELSPALFYFLVEELGFLSAILIHFG